MEARLNKGQHPFLNEVSLNVGADFQIIPSEDTRKQTQNIHPYMQLNIILRKRRKIFNEIFMIRC